MRNFNRIDVVVSEHMGAVRVPVKLTNATDEDLISRGLLNPDRLRVYETEALVDTGAVRTVVPMAIVQQLGLRIRDRQLAKYADGREEMVGITSPVIIEIMGRETTKAVLVTGDEVLIGRTALTTLDLILEYNTQRLIPNPAHPKQPVFRI